MDEEGAVIYAFGERWGPERDKPDQYFGFEPGNGIHDIHMNQGNDGKWRRDNGTYQDAALYIEYPNDKWRAFHFAFQSQTFETDDEGNALDARQPLTAVSRSARTKKPRGATSRGGKSNGRKKPNVGSKSRKGRKRPK